MHKNNIQNPRLLTLVLALTLLFCGRVRAQNQPPKSIQLSVDATRAPQKVLHAELDIPASPGPLTLY
ncbi:MAG: hypothetical protein WCD40_05820, partial [Candidatus Acidiferrales bacterium]